MATADTQVSLTNTTIDQASLARIQCQQGSDNLESLDDRLIPILGHGQTYLQQARKRMEDDYKEVVMQISPINQSQECIQRLRRMLESIRCDLKKLADRRQRVLTSLGQHIAQDEIWQLASEDTFTQLNSDLRSFTPPTPSTPLLAPFTSLHTPPLSPPPKISIPYLPCDELGRAFIGATIHADSEKEEDEQEDEGYGSLAGTPKTSSSRCLVYGEV